MNDTYMGFGEAQRTLGVSSSTLYRWVNAGLISYIRKPSGRLLFERKEVLTYYQNHKKGSKEI